jgi:hypothetical protein
LREDPGVDILWTVLIVFTFVTAFAATFRRGADGPNWELRWRTLGADGRARIVTAANSREARAALTAPEDLTLLAGYRRHKRRRRGQVDLAATSILVVASAFTLVGLLNVDILGFVAGLFLLPAATWEYLSEKQMDGRLRAVVDAETPAAR